jgi:hypothetical protein
MAENYKLISDRGPTFNVRIAYEPGITVYSTRETGKMERDDSINWTDIVFQIQGPYANDWTIEQLPDTPDKDEEGEPSDTEAADTDDKFLPRRR